MTPLDQNRSIDSHKPNHTTKVQNKFIPHGSILERLMNFASSVPDLLQQSGAAKTGLCYR